MIRRVAVLLALSAAIAACGEGDGARKPVNEPPALKIIEQAPEPIAVEADAPGEDAALEGLLRRGDTLATAKARLGQDNVQARALDGAEGETFNGWLLYPDDPDRSIEIALDASGKHPVAMLLRGQYSAWTRGDGVRIGMTSAELQELNGRPFGFIGFGWDYGGAVIDWRRGELDAGDGPRGSVALCPPDEAPEDYPSGESTYSSDDPRLIAHPAVVCQYNLDIAK